MRIALIHAVRVALQPVEDAFARHWPQAERVAALAEYALAGGASAILYTCSAFGEAIQGVKSSSRVPVLKPNEAMFEDALGHGRRIGMLAEAAPRLAGCDAIMLVS